MSPPAQFGKDRDYNVDLIPKFAMASGEFTNILYHTDVTRYMEFRQIEGSFVFRDGRISKVSSSMGPFSLTNRSLPIKQKQSCLL